MLVICLRSAVSNNNKNVAYVFNITEVQNTSANCIKNAVSTDFNKYGLNKNIFE